MGGSHCCLCEHGLQHGQGSWQCKSGDTSPQPSIKFTDLWPPLHAAYLYAFSEVKHELAKNTTSDCISEATYCHPSLLFWLPEQMPSVWIRGKHNLE